MSRRLSRLTFQGSKSSYFFSQADLLSIDANLPKMRETDKPQEDDQAQSEMRDQSQERTEAVQTDDDVVVLAFG